MSADHVHLAAPPETLDEDPPLAELMTAPLLGVTPDTGIKVALCLLTEAGVRHLPVMDGARCLGLVFEHDVLRRVADGGWMRSELSAGELCRPAPMLRPGDRRSAATGRMWHAGVDAVLVVADDKLIGIVTATDVLRSLAGAPSGGASAESTL